MDILSIVPLAQEKWFPQCVNGFLALKLELSSLKRAIRRSESASCTDSCVFRRAAFFPAFFSEFSFLLIFQHTKINFGYSCEGRVQCRVHLSCAHNLALPCICISRQVVFMMRPIEEIGGRLGSSEVLKWLCGLRLCIFEFPPIFPNLLQFIRIIPNHRKTP